MIVFIHAFSELNIKLISETTVQNDFIRKHLTSLEKRIVKNFHEYSLQ